MEQGLFAPQATFGGLQTGAGANQAGLMAQQASFLPQLMGSLGGAAIQGAAMGGMMGGATPAAGVSTNYNASFPTLPSWTG